jgi:EAL domain-containing protein (putative c-di-GMP-specific phosphodiesterase class I)
VSIPLFSHGLAANSLMYQGVQSLGFVDGKPAEARSFTVLYIDVIGFSRFEERHGADACDTLIESLRHAVQERIPMLGRPGCRALHVWDDGFAVMVQGHCDQELIHAAHGFVHAVEVSLNAALGSAGYPAVRLRHGISAPNPPRGSDDMGRQLYRQITEAARVARRQSSLPESTVVEEFYRVLRTGDIRLRYQPIVHFDSWQTIGWECLSRGPAQSQLEHPERLFECADQLGHLFDLERLCRDRAISGAEPGMQQKLFLNICPRTLIDPAFRHGETRILAERRGLRPDQIVFEITEHQAVDDYRLFNRVIEHYRKQGYQIAIDDTGAGYSGLVTLMEIKPDYVKVDMNLVRSMHLNRTKRDIVSAIQKVSAGFGAIVIAEGIETSEELEAVRECGVEYGQGYLLGMPAERCCPSTFFGRLAESEFGRVT